MQGMSHIHQEDIFQTCITDYQYVKLFQVDGVDRCDLKITAPVLDCLGQEQAIQIMLEQEKVSNRLKKGIVKTHYELYPGCRAILHIFTDRSVKKKKEIEIDNLAAGKSQHF